MHEARRSAPQAAGAALAALERYGVHMAQLATRRLDAELYHAVALDIEAVRLCCVDIPGTATAWTGLLIAHAEMIHGLWRASRGEEPDLPGQLARVQEHAGHVQAVCMRLAAPPPAG